MTWHVFLIITGFIGSEKNIFLREFGWKFHVKQSREAHNVLPRLGEEKFNAADCENSYLQVGLHLRWFGQALRELCVSLISRSNKSGFRGTLSDLDVIPDLINPLRPV